MKAKLLDSEKCCRGGHCYTTACYNIFFTATKLHTAEKLLEAMFSNVIAPKLYKGKQRDCILYVPLFCNRFVKVVDTAHVSRPGHS
jgi:hypothetical protein